jgi:hypothetical protein
MQNDLQLTLGELRLGKDVGRKGLDLSDPARNKVDMGELLRQLVTEGTWHKQYELTWEDFVAAGAVASLEVALSAEGEHPDWLIAEDAFVFLAQEFAGTGVTAADLDVGFAGAAPDPDALLPAVDVFAAPPANGLLGLGAAEKGAALIITGGQGKPTAIITDGLTATLTLTGGDMEDLTAGIVRIIVLGKKAINPDALELAPLP